MNSIQLKYKAQHEKEVSKIKKEIEYLRNELKQWKKLKSEFEKDYKNPYYKEYKGSLSVDIAQCKMNIDIKEDKIKSQESLLDKEIQNFKALK